MTRAVLKRLAAAMVFLTLGSACEGVDQTLPQKRSLAVTVGTLVTVAGGGTSLGDGGPATSAGFCQTADVAIDGAGNMYIADAGLACSGPGAHTVRKVDPSGIITTVAGTGEPGFSGDGGPATSAQLNAPIGVATDREGNLYIADLFNYRIRKVDPTGTITTIAGIGERGFSGDGGPATEARLFAPAEELGTGRSIFPGGMAFDPEGNLYVADGGAVRKIDASGTISTVAGTGVPGFSRDGDRATQAMVTAVDVAVDPEGNLFLSDFTSRVRRVDREGIITTVAGTGMRGKGRDGAPATSVPLHDPLGIAVVPDGTLFIAEHHRCVIRKVDPEGLITTVAGTGLCGSSVGRGSATEVNLWEPVGLFADQSRVLYIADTFNGRILALRYDDA
jgi:sugar lactone lactonase YvrE